MTAHSSVVGGSTAKRVMACPGSVALVQKMPPQKASKYAEEGSMLHLAIERLVDTEDLLGTVRADMELTDEQCDKLTFCINALDEIDPKQEMAFACETRVEFEGVKGLENCFGTIDLLGRLGDRAIVLDWKFGDGVIVDAEENAQGLFYAAAAMRTAKAQWAFEGATEVEIIIVQPFQVRRWVTTLARVVQFERDLVKVVRLALQPDAPLATGDHCRWCAAKPVCPQMTGLAERTLATQLATIDADNIGRMLAQADMVEDWIKGLRELAFTMLENDRPVPGYKLVPKRAVRQWVDEQQAEKALLTMGVEPYKQELISPAQAEKLLKKSKLALPDDLVVAVSSGSTIAPESDPRPAVLNLGTRLVAALSKLQ